jgi:hypothetical protein
MVLSVAAGLLGLRVPRLAVTLAGEGGLEALF